MSRESAGDVSPHQLTVAPLSACQQEGPPSEDQPHRQENDCTAQNQQQQFTLKLVYMYSAGSDSLAPSLEQHEDDYLSQSKPWAFLCLIQVTIIAVSQVKLDIIIIIKYIYNTPAILLLITDCQRQNTHRDIYVDKNKHTHTHTHTHTKYYTIDSEFLDQRDGLAVTMATVLPGPNNPSDGHTHQYHNQRHTRHYSDGNPRDLPEAPPTVPVTLALVVVAVWERLGIQPSILGLHGL